MGGKQLVLEARSGGAWLQFDTITTAGPITYQFRILSPREADFPYLAGTSNVVDVHER